ncbi:MAG: hypothetical protein ACE5I4_08015, partial [Thermoplasmata archaeon]
PAVSPFVVLGEPEKPSGKAKERRGKKAKKGKKGKKSKRRRKGKKAKAAAPTMEVEAVTPEPDKEPGPTVEEPPEPPSASADEEGMLSPAESAGSVPTLTVKQIWDASKTQLREWCQQLGIDDTGPIMNLRLRLLSRIEAS